MKEIKGYRYWAIPLFIIAAGMSGISDKGYLKYLTLVTGIAVFILFVREYIEILKTNKILLLFYGFAFWALLTAVWSYSPSISIYRSLYLMFVITTGILSGYVWYEKFKNLLCFLPLNVLVVLISIISLVLGIPDDNWKDITVKAFSGFMPHPNTLGAIILFSAVPIIIYMSDFFRNKVLMRENKKVQYLLVLLLIANVLILSITFSRASILSFILFTGLYIINYSMKALFSAVITVTLIVIIAYFAYNEIITNVQEKYVFKGTESIISTRQKLYSDSFEAAMHGGVFGLGYGVSDTNITNPVYTNQNRNIREKGNSFLALGEETGLAGIVIFLLPFLIISGRILRSKKKYSRNDKLILYLLIAIFVHSQFEAWVTGVGSFSLLYLYVITGGLVTGDWKSRG